MGNYSEPSAFSKYLTVNEQDREWRIYCTCLGSSKITPGASYPLRPAEHPVSYVSDWQNPGKGRILHEFQLLYITRGKGSFFSGGELFRIREGTVFMLFPGVPHWYCPDIDTGWNEYWVGYSGGYPEELIQRGIFSSDRPVFRIGIHRDLVEDFYKIFALAESQPPGFQPRCGAVIMGILAKITSYLLQEQQGSEVEQLMNNARILFEENIHRSPAIEEIVRALQVDYGWFRNIFKNYTGLSPYRYFLQMKMNRAKQLLQTGELSVKETAYQLGFQNQYYFSRMFKKKTGMSPTEWQAKNSLG